MKRRIFGLIGRTLQHSFSPRYFAQKFEREGLHGCGYQLFELATIADFPAIWSVEDLVGVNVTIPYKEEVMAYVDRLAPSAQRVGAVNVVYREADGSLTGHNTDYEGFRDSLLETFGHVEMRYAAILGTGGASKAVEAVLEDWGIGVMRVSRHPQGEAWSYGQLAVEADKMGMVVNATPLGTFPKVDEMPAVEMGRFLGGTIFYDLVYNPSETRFLREAGQRGFRTLNGLRMLEIQADASWRIWNERG